MAVSGGPLDGVRVVEAGAWFAVPLAGKLMADLGANVTKLERPDGDVVRRYGPFAPGEEGDTEGSGLFAHLNSCKQSVVVPSDAAITAILDRLDQKPEILLVDERFLRSNPAADVASLRRRFPALVIVTVLPFGIGGPYAGYASYDITAAASGGISCGIGEPDRPPLPLPFFQSEQQAGICAAIAALMGLLAARRDAVGDHIDLSIQEILAALHCGYFLPRYLFGGGIVGLRTGRVGGAQPYPNTVLHCRDGLVALIGPKIAHWRRFLALMGNPEWAERPRYRNRRAMQWEYKAEVDALVEPWLMERDKAELIELFVTHRIPFAPLLTGRDIAKSDHLYKRGAIRSVTMPNGTSVQLPGAPYRFTRSVWRCEAAPRLGQHGRLESRELPESTHTQEGRSGPDGRAIGLAETTSAPLSGLRVLDLGTAWAGGIAGRLLGDCGADVVKVESWTHMDGSRMGRPILVDDPSGGDAGEWPDLQPGFHVHGRSKRSLTLDLRTDQGRQILRRLAAQADVLIHNFSPRAARALGVAYEDLATANERLIVVGQSVAGSEGPLANYIGYASTVAALGGLAHGIGYEGEEPIGSFEGIYTDVVSAITTVYATVAAIVERQTSGLGQGVDVSQWEATLALCPIPLIEYSLGGDTTGSQGFYHPLLCPHGNYPAHSASGDDAVGGTWLSIAVGDGPEWQALLERIDPDHVLGPDAVEWGVTGRRRHVDEIERLIVSWLETVDVQWAQDELQRCGVAAFRVLNIADSFIDPQLSERGTYISVAHPKVGDEPMPGLPWNFARARCAVTRRAPLLGEHSFEVLHEALGISQQEFAGLVAAGVVEVGPPRPLRKA